MLDQMWGEPRTLLWPLYGWHFERVPVYIPDWLAQMLYSVTHDPGTYLPEIAGLAILIAFVWRHLKWLKSPQGTTSTHR
jgi:hypothetical protein